MDLSEALAQIIEGQTLSQANTKAVFDTIMAGEATPAQIAGILMALRVRGESPEEIAGAAEAMRQVSTKVVVDVPNLVDTCGTGGSAGAKLFNVSTAAAFVVAGAGGHVAKHGNRGMTSRSGSADLLEAAGVNIALTPAQIARCIEEIGVGFLFAQAHHSAMRHAGPIRQELRVRTIFNLLGPLTNPAGAERQLIGVFAPEWQLPVAEVAKLLGSTHVMVVHANGLDALSISGTSNVVELKNDEIRQYAIEPEDFGMTTRTVESLHADSPTRSLELVRQSLSGDDTTGAANIVALNAGAAIYVAGIVETLAHGVSMAEDAIASGLAAEKLAELTRVSRLMETV